MACTVAVEDTIEHHYNKYSINCSIKSYWFYGITASQSAKGATCKSSQRRRVIAGVVVNIQSINAKPVLVTSFALYSPPPSLKIMHRNIVREGESLEYRNHILDSDDMI